MIISGSVGASLGDQHFALTDGSVLVMPRGVPHADAKVLLSVRDPQQWWASTVSTIYGFRTAFPAWMLRLVPMTHATGWR